jgi:putative membrane protein
MFEAGFLGTRAPFFMDMVTIYFALLPFLVAFSIYMAITKRYALHFRFQMSTFILTMVMVVIFEIGVRVDGGFNAYMQESSLSYNAVFVYLIIHILFALLTVVAWGITRGLLRHILKSIKKEHDGYFWRLSSPRLWGLRCTPSYLYYN